ncbi:MAG TPA: Mrp/NBP35 family ATP-binding protein [Methanothermobacter sp.]|jgi:Mrp family chromosome partitioning ATPase|uniref:Iron-sulfur cluster carrier protein n=1 Tax=Methanothermobacter tenebrarum TaxID=680118 RepID=A0ABN6PCJ1_9EURY|nr:Mrp/NBP35 family ATP-binding protein [Methanothermobacter tenebrarum]MDI6882023.1 Mrp/NBP35 family ATP-binding protein [Methanothermobacter sp.]MDX9694009.1 Mrp/NBP35 family ATP-binding protein [Methanothermobacter sp.]BDH79940.1 ATP-binding protein [Methanothermobacter tenebrarum]HHW16503.1 Mrp/NBP35 family ATP-binding protein [Methanothermobacter sp.]HOQ20295.1 Mrp/NBP35 family ATP-binding protein [Methanothermobacter sp.]
MNTEDTQKLAIMKQDVEIARALSNIKHKIVVMSGKGGVGKSTITVKLAEEFNRDGYKVCILDADIHGPDIPEMMQVHEPEVTLTGNKINPTVTPSGVRVLSIEFFLPSKDTPVIWRGPKKTGAIRQFLSDVNWDGIDVLMVDNPPGTGDEPLTVLQSIPSINGAVIVTTPHKFAIHDVKKCVNMVKHMKIPVLGIIENMSYLKCPSCGEKIFLFGKEGGKYLAEKFNLRFLGKVPFDTRMTATDAPPTLIHSEIRKIFKNLKESLKDR